MSTDSGYPSNASRRGNRATIAGAGRSPVPRVDVELFDDNDLLPRSSIDSETLLPFYPGAAMGAGGSVDFPQSESFQSGIFSDEEWISPDPEMQVTIIEQMESLFSDDNLCKDAFLRKHVLKNKDGFVNIKLITSFKKIKCLTKDWRAVAFSIQNLQPANFTMNPEKTKVRRVEPLPDFDESGAPSRTIAVLNLPTETSNIASVGDQFAPCGEISSVRLFRPGKPLPSELRNLVNSNPQTVEASSTAIVEFEAPESVASALALFPANQLESGVIVQELAGKPMHQKKRKRVEEKRDQFARATTLADPAVLGPSCRGGGRTFSRVVGQLSLPQEGSTGLFSGGSSESISSSDYSSHQKLFARRGGGGQVGSLATNLLSPAGYSSFHSTPCSSPLDGSTDHLAPTSFFGGQQHPHSHHGSTVRGSAGAGAGAGAGATHNWLSPTPSSENFYCPSSPGDSPRNGRKSNYPIYNWNALLPTVDPSLYERRYSDIPVHQTQTAEHLQRLGNASEAWKRTSSFSFEDQHAAMGRSDSQLLQLSGMCLDESSPFSDIPTCKSQTNLLYPPNSATTREAMGGSLSPSNFQQALASTAAVGFDTSDPLMCRPALNLSGSPLPSVAISVEPPSQSETDVMEEFPGPSIPFAQPPQMPSFNPIPGSSRRNPQPQPSSPKPDS